MAEAMARFAVMPRAGWFEEAASLAAGLAFTSVLFFGMAHFERNGGAEPPADFAELHSVSVPLELPPPRIQEEPQPIAETALPFAGLEIGESESPVKIAVVPPDLEDLLPHSDVPPAAAIQVAQLVHEFKPKMDLEADFSRVFQATEVDQRPTVLARPNPFIPSNVRNKAKVLRVLLLITVETNGSVHSVRVLNPSGNPKFDAIIVESVQHDWAFTPAIKKGRKVRCLIQQSVAVTWRSDGTPFDP
jgi:TonB family protein